LAGQPDVVVRGRLRDPGTAPAVGEEMLELLACRDLVVEQILSSASTRAAAYLQEHAEWVIVLAGGASMTVGGDPVELGPGDWVFLPAGVPHTVERTEQGTSWLAVHLH
jgi:cupin 2 domain-containing protein